MILPQPPGGTMETNARALAEQMVPSLGQQIVLDPRSGANGIIAGSLLAKSQPDGYTLLFTSGSLLYNEIAKKEVPFVAARDFAPVTAVARSMGYIVLTNPQLPAKSVAELVELSKRSGARVNYGSSGYGNSQHFVGELFNITTGAKLTNVPYKGFGPLIIALIGNEIQVAFGAPPTTLPHIKQGRLRAIAYTGTQRWAGLPDMPTVAESGYPGFSFEPAGHGIFAPAGTPAAVILKFQGEVARAVHSPKLLKYFEAGGYIPMGSTPGEFRKLIDEDMKKMRAIARQANITPQ
jgi:tripartite-type tricarboxylate transporter receptor subunit TctC